MSEGRTWRSEDTQQYSFKVFFALGMLRIGQHTGIQLLRLLPCSEAECIVLAMEGLLLAHELRSIVESGMKYAGFLPFFSVLGDT